MDNTVIIGSLIAIGGAVGTIQTFFTVEVVE